MGPRRRGGVRGDARVSCRISCRLRAALACCMAPPCCVGISQRCCPRYAPVGANALEDGWIRGALCLKTRK